MSNTPNQVTPRTRHSTRFEHRSLPVCRDAGGKVTYSYGPTNELTRIAGPGGNCTTGPVVQPCTTIGYLDSTQSDKYQSGQPTSVTFPSGRGLTETLSYDNAENQTLIKATKGATTLDNHAYTYAQTTNDTTGRQTVTDASAKVTTNTYDTQSRLTEAKTIRTGTTTADTGQDLRATGEGIGFANSLLGLSIDNAFSPWL